MNTVNIKPFYGLSLVSFSITCYQNSKRLVSEKENRNGTNEIYINAINIALFQLSNFAKVVK